MQTPREIADARLARGEISVEEHGRIIDTISPSSSQPSSSRETPPAKQASSSWDGLKALLGLGALVLFGIYFYNQFNKAGPGTFTIGNLQSTGAKGIVSFKIANPSDRSDDVVMYIVQGNSRMCEHVGRLEKKRSYDIRFACRSMGLGDFKIVAEWASYSPEIANIASRL
ncbi:hypothetical protein [Stappia indica]|uniref:hypothetical protein n=1 Tax=Stappia indica TaxID=538381 RepID=UPI001D187705|nr:hypothetical protein [Stappia indica]MCC4242969.1 hypothetical protein [Stappia indica]